MTELKKSISGCHKYFEQNIYTMFEKIVADCWIDYLCRQNNTNSAALWNSFINCKNEFEKTIFARLSEYRHKHGVNQWVNLLRIQEYAARKVDFVFGEKVRNPKDASCKANYFDLMFNVAANELGFGLNEISVNKIYPMGRIPNSPFVLNSVSREILRNVITEIPYDKEIRIDKSEHFPDNDAMDAFSIIKKIIPEEPDTISKTLVKSMSEIPARVYMPVSFKAAIDLEIDVLTESGASLQHCERCGEYFIRDEEYDYDYCDTIRQGEMRSCLEIVRRETAPEIKNGPRTKFLPNHGNPPNAEPHHTIVNTTDNKPETERIGEDELMRLCDRLYREFAARVNVDITQRDLSEWYRELKIIRNQLLSNQASMDDFEDFVRFSREIRFSQKNPRHTTQPALNRDDKIKNKEVKPFVFERVNDTAPIQKKYSAVLENIIDNDDRNSYETENNSSGYTRRPTAYAPQSRVIRGAFVQQSAAVEIPAAFSQKSVKHEQPGFVRNTPEVAQKSAPDTVNSRNLSAAKGFDDDMKIYRSPNQSPQRPPMDEDVKVFEPAVKNKSVQPRPLRETNEELFANINRVSNSLREESAANYNRYNNYADAPKNPAPYRLHNESAANNTDAPKNPAPYRLRNESANANNTDAESESAKKNAAFDDILKGFDRKDGFEIRDEDIPTDSDGVPVSHKTKRVLDVIMKPTKPSVFVAVDK
jgi:hypothetical protein